MPFTSFLYLGLPLMPSFFTRLLTVRQSRGSSRGESAGRPVVDIVFLMAIAVFLMLTLALVAGCAALERKK
jgi:ACR3 family arsenite efflux pump ArsB